MRVRVFGVVGDAARMLLTALLVVILVACSTGRVAPPADNILSVSKGLPAPSSMRVVAALSQNANGSDFSDELPSSLVDRVDTTAKYSPEDEPGLDHVAFAIYPLDLTGFAGEARFAFTWSDPPGNPATGDCWLGLANWNADGWDWFMPEDPGFFAIDPVEDYIRDADSLLLLAVAVAGAEQAVLEQISASSDLPPVVMGVSPISGNSTEQVQFSAQLEQGDEPLSYSWYFGSATTPTTSPDESPTVTMGIVGQYDCQLIVSNGAGQSVFPFSVRVNDADHWIHTYGQYFGELPEDCVLDHAGNLIVSASNQRATFYKISPTGVLLWAAEYGTPDSRNDLALGLAVDAENNIYVAGGYDWDYPSSKKCLLLKLDADGNCLWAKTWDDLLPNHDMATAVCVDKDGNPVFAGHSNSRPGGSQDILLMKLTPAGEIIWQKLWGADDFEDTTNIHTDASGNLHLGGWCKDYSFDHNEHVIYLKFDGDGEPLAQYLLDDAFIGQIAISPDGQAVLGTGYSTIYKFDNAAQLEWVREVEGDDYFQWRELAMTPSGQIAAGSIFGIELNPGTIFKPALVMLNPDGTLDWARRWEGYENGDEYLRGLTFAPNCSLYAVARSDDCMGSWYDIPVTSSVSAGQATAITGDMYAADGFLEDLETTMRPIEIVTDTGGGYTDIMVTKF